MIQFLKCVLLFTIATQLHAKNVYVSISGSDANTGTQESPFRTLAKAVSVMSAGDVCIIRGGVYEEELNIDKNGTQNAYLTFKAAEGEDVQIKATATLSGWQLHSGNIYKTSVDMQIDSRFRTVYHNGNYMDLARWPNNTDNDRWTVDCHPVEGGDGAHFTVSNIQNIDWTGGLVYYLGAHSGASWTRRITNSSSTRIDFTQVDISKWPFSTHNPTQWRNNPNNKRGQLFLFDKLEALDHPREWYYDKTNKLLYFYAADGTKPQDDTVEYAARRYTAQIYGDYIKIEGIHFYGGTVKVHRNANNNQLLNCKVTHGVEGHDSLSNTSAQVGEAAVEVLGFNTLIKGCTVNHSAFNGITLVSWAGAHDSTVEECYISNTDYVGIHASPIRTSANNVKILKNTIYNTGRDGMYVNGSNCEIAYNDVSASQKINADSGIFYVVGNSNLKNTEIHHNWFHDATAPTYSHEQGKPGKAAGIYLDNNSKGYTVHHNVVWNVSWSGYQVNWNNTHLDFFHNTIWNAERAMDSWVNGYKQENNRIYNNFSNTGEWFSETNTDFDIKDNIIAAISPFENPANKNFMLKPGSELINQAKPISGFEKPFVGSAPDIGAYEFGGTRWTAGVGAIEDTGEGEALDIYDTAFTIAVTSETCPNKNNGTIDISANFESNYTAVLNGNETPFTKEHTFSNVPPGEYQLCIYSNDVNQRQCFGVVVNEGAKVNAKSTLVSNALIVEILEGTPPFSIQLNDKHLKETNESVLKIEVNQGDIVKIKSSIECEGELLHNIDFYHDLTVYPNPTANQAVISFPVKSGKIEMALYDINGKQLSNAVYLIKEGSTSISLSEYAPGIYFLKPNGGQKNILRIVKK